MANNANRIFIILLLCTTLFHSQTQKQLDSVVISSKRNCNYESAYNFFNKEYNRGNRGSLFLFNYCCFISLSKAKTPNLYKSLNYILKNDSILANFLINDPDFFNISNTKKWELFAVKVIKKTLPKSDTTLALSLCKMGIRDQAYYTDWYCNDKKFGNKSSQSKKIIKTKDSLNNLNLKIADSILSNSEFPSKLFYKNLTNRLFLVIQHADTAFMNKYIDTIYNASNRGDLDKGCYPLIYDRLMVCRKGMQYYGTQINSESNKPYPIIDAKKVDIRRKEYELEPLKNYLKKFGIKYSQEK